MSFLRHDGIYRSDVVRIQTRGGTPPSVGRRPCPGKRRDGRSAPWLIVRDEFRPVIPRSSCSPAELVSASPADSVSNTLRHSAYGNSSSGTLSEVSVSHPRGAVQTLCPVLRSRLCRREQD